MECIMFSVYGMHYGWLWLSEEVSFVFRCKRKGEFCCDFEDSCNCEAHQIASAEKQVRFNKVSRGGTK